MPNTPKSPTSEPGSEPVEEEHQSAEEYDSDDDRNFEFESFDDAMHYLVTNAQLFLPAGSPPPLTRCMSPDKKEALRVAVSKMRNGIVLGGEGLPEACVAFKDAVHM